jgi:hypothetical protein
MSTTVTQWNKLAKKALQGQRITNVRYLTPVEASRLGWSYQPISIQLEDGSLFFPSMDDEGNDAGALFGQDADGNEVTIPVMREQGEE